MSARNKFMKKEESILFLELVFSSSVKNNVTLLKEKRLLGNFIGPWPSYEVVEDWVFDNWENHEPKGISYYGNGY